MIMLNIGARFIIDELDDDLRKLISNTVVRRIVIFCSGVSIKSTLFPSNWFTMSDPQAYLKKSMYPYHCHHLGMSSQRKRNPAKKSNVTTYDGRAAFATSIFGDKAATKYATTIPHPSVA